MADASKRGSRLVLAFVLVASVAVIFAWHSRPVPRQGWRTILEEPGVPAARRGMELSRRGRQLLSPHERQEMDRLYAEALRNLPEHERQVFAALSQSGLRRARVIWNTAPRLSRNRSIRCRLKNKTGCLG